METKVNGGAIFKNEKKADTHPDYKGTINVDGQDKEIALWVKQSAKGTTYFSVNHTIQKQIQTTQSRLRSSPIGRISSRDMRPVRPLAWDSRRRRSARDMTDR